MLHGYNLLFYLSADINDSYFKNSFENIAAYFPFLPNFVYSFSWFGFYLIIWEKIFSDGNSRSPGMITNGGVKWIHRTGHVDEMANFELHCKVIQKDE